MGKYQVKTEQVNAEQWFLTGDLGGDQPLVSGEGKIVKPYHRDDVHPDLVCSLCAKPMKKHGWIEALDPLDPAVAAVPIDPTTTKPVVLADRGKRVDGKDMPAVAVPAGGKLIDPKRGDLNGLVVCPGDWVVTHENGVRECVKPGTFAALYASAY